MPRGTLALRALREAILDALVLEGGEQYPKLSKGFEHVKFKYPRVMSRVLRAKVDPTLIEEGRRQSREIWGAQEVARFKDLPKWVQELVKQRGKMSAIPDPYDYNFRTSLLRFNPEAETLPQADILELIGHEANHAAQQLARPWLPLDYFQENLRRGYADNPYEIGSRIAGGKTAIEYLNPGARPQSTRNLAQIEERLMFGNRREQAQALWRAITGQYRRR